MQIEKGNSPNEYTVIVENSVVRSLGLKDAAWNVYGIPLRIKKAAPHPFFAHFLIDGRSALSREYDGKLTLIDGDITVSCRHDISIFLSPIKKISSFLFGLSPLMFSWVILIPSFSKFIILQLLST